MTERWQPPTLRTDPATGGNVPVICPSCGRETSADMVVDLSTLTDAQAVAWGITSLFLCDGCIARGIRSGRFTREDLVEALGAPTAVVDRMRAKES